MRTIKIYSQHISSRLCNINNNSHYDLHYISRSHSSSITETLCPLANISAFPTLTTPGNHYSTLSLKDSTSLALPWDALFTWLQGQHKFNTVLLPHWPRLLQILGWFFLIPPILSSSGRAMLYYLHSLPRWSRPIASLQIDIDMLISLPNLHLQPELLSWIQAHFFHRPLYIFSQRTSISNVTCIEVKLLIILPILTSVHRTPSSQLHRPKDLGVILDISSHQQVLLAFTSESCFSWWWSLSSYHQLCPGFCKAFPLVPPTYSESFIYTGGNVILLKTNSDPVMALFRSQNPISDPWGPMF